MNKKDICQNLEDTLEKVKVIEENQETIKKNEKILHKIRRKDRLSFYADRKSILSWVIALAFVYILFTKSPIFDAIFFVLGARNDGVLTLYEKVITIGMFALMVGCYFFVASKLSKFLKKFSASTIRAKKAIAIINEYNEKNDELYSQLEKESIVKHRDHLTSDALISFLDYLSKDLNTLEECMGRYDDRQFRIKLNNEVVSAQKATQAHLKGIQYNTAQTNKKLSDIEDSVERMEREFRS
ncbi:hypothetical protein ABEX78_21900 [Priestia megaterium]